ncbi:hypothetical protein Saa2_07734 [Streptomyces acidiscabies]|nr:hypothetical protein Saa2_07734 [Streptomyces acidiscabies]
MGRGRVGCGGVGVREVSVCEVGRREVGGGRGGGEARRGGLDAGQLSRSGVDPGEADRPEVGVRQVCRRGGDVGKLGRAALAQPGHDGDRTDRARGTRRADGGADGGRVLPVVQEVFGPMDLGTAPGPQRDGGAVGAHALLGKVRVRMVVRMNASAPQHPQPRVGEHQRRPPVQRGSEPLQHRPGRLQHRRRSHDRRRVPARIAPHPVEPGPPPGRHDLLRYPLGHRPTRQEPLPGMPKSGKGRKLLCGRHDTPHRTWNG